MLGRQLTQSRVLRAGLHALHSSALALLLLTATAFAAEVPTDITQVLEIRDGWEYGVAPDPLALDRQPETWQGATLPRELGTEPCGFFRATFPVPAAWSRQRIAVVIRARSGTVSAWLNGQAVGARPATALDLRLDVTGAVRPGAANTVLIAISAPGTADRGALDACWLEATAAVGVSRLVASTLCLPEDAVIDVRVDVANPTPDRFEGRVELALEPAVQERGRNDVWRRQNDIRMEPGQTATSVQSYEIERPRLWRFDDPFLYRLTATVRTRENEAIHTASRLVGLRSTEVVDGRWLVNGDWLRLAGLAVRVPGATLLGVQSGQASAAAERVASVRDLPEVLDFCDAQGIAVLLDAPAHGDGTPGWREALSDLAEAAASHPCVWGWAVCGESEAYRLAVEHVRALTPRLPVGCPVPDLPTEAQPFDFVVDRYSTKADRQDNDGYGRRLDDLLRDAGGKPVIALDRMAPEQPGDRDGVLRSLAHRRGEAGRRPAVAMLLFDPESMAGRAEPPRPQGGSAGTDVLGLLGAALRASVPRAERDDALLRRVEQDVCVFALRPPGHEARRDGNAFVVKTRFEVWPESPVAQRIPCYSLSGYRLAWHAAMGTAPTASGVVPLRTVRPRSLDGGPEPARGECEWRLDKAGTVELTIELQNAAGRVLRSDRSTLTLGLKPDGNVDLRVEPPKKTETQATPPAPAVRPEAVLMLDVAPYFNNDGLSWKANPTDGNFDLSGYRNGANFIADLLPKGDAPVEVPGRPGLVFRFPNKDDRRSNNVLCDGQRILLPQPREAFEAAWFLGACHGGSKAALLRIEYEDADGQGELRLTDWLAKPPGAGEADVLRLPARHTFDGKEEPKECGMVAWRVPLDPRRKLVAIHLPRERGMHGFAVTLIRSGAK